jgi:hypothetical protein
MSVPDALRAPPPGSQPHGGDRANPERPRRWDDTAPPRITEQDTSLAASQSENEQLRDDLDQFTAVFGDDFFTTESYGKLVAAHRFYQPNHGYTGSLTDMIVENVELLLNNMGITLRRRT